jgi:hypothetical protein
MDCQIWEDIKANVDTNLYAGNPPAESLSANGTFSSSTSWGSIVSSIISLITELVTVYNNTTNTHVANT